MDGPSPVSKSGIKSGLGLRSLAYASWLTHSALGKGVCIYTYWGGVPSISVLWHSSLSPGGAGSVPGGGGTGCCRGAPVPLRHQYVCGFCGVPFWKWRQLSIWFSQTIARCLSIAVFKFLYPGNSIPHFFSSQTSAGSILISCCIFSIVARKTLCWPFGLYSTQGACQTVPAVPNRRAWQW